MLITTIGALVYKGYHFFHDKSWLLGIVAMILVVLALVIVYDARQILLSRQEKNRPVGKI